MMTIMIKKNNEWMTVKNIYTYQDSHWRTIKSAYINQHNTWQLCWQNVKVAINNTPQTSINIFDFMGRPIRKGRYIFINNAEIIANNGEVALDTGQFPQGSTLSIINNSSIIGYGGNGGNYDTSGQDGGNAICLNFPTLINNSNGLIYAGGGGGGGIYFMIKVIGGSTNSKITGGGAGGFPNGKCLDPWSRPSNGISLKCEYTNSSDGNSEGGGQGGAMPSVILGTGSITINLIQLFTGFGGDIAGDGLSSTYKVLTSLPSLYSYSLKTQVGGNAGLAISKNGYGLTLINPDSQRIKGVIL